VSQEKITTMEKIEIEKLKIDFLKEAIKDQQNIIANTDTKARLLLAVNVAVIAGLLIIFNLLIKHKLFLNLSILSSATLKWMLAFFEYILNAKDLIIKICTAKQG
jgi:hypothetical protein